MIDFLLWSDKDGIWFVQGSDTCCFVYAVANCLTARGQGITNYQLNGAIEVACCETGSTISAPKVVKYLDAPLVETEDPEEVFEQGGVIQIWHPIFNGHSFYLDQKCEDEGALRLLNSWLGPPVALNVGRDELLPFITDRCGPHWKFNGTGKT